MDANRTDTYLASNDPSTRFLFDDDILHLTDGTTPEMAALNIGWLTDDDEYVKSKTQPEAVLATPEKKVAETDAKTEEPITNPDVAVSPLRPLIRKVGNFAQRLTRKFETGEASEQPEATKPAVSEHDGLRGRRRLAAGLALTGLLVGVTNRDLATSLLTHQGRQSHAPIAEKLKEPTREATVKAGEWVPPSVLFWHDLINQTMQKIQNNPRYLNVGYRFHISANLAEAVMLPLSGGDPFMQGPNGRGGAAQMTVDQGNRYMKDGHGFDPYNPVMALPAFLLDLDNRYTEALQSREHKDEESVIRATIEGPAPGRGIDPDPQNASRLADLITKFYAGWGNKTNDAFNAWSAAPNVKVFLDRAAKDMLARNLLTPGNK